MARISKTNEHALEKKPLADGVALVTGGSRGIGLAIAQQLAILGASISICGRDRTALEGSARALAKLGVPVHGQIADVTNPVEIADLVAKTEAALGPITILVNNAGIGLFGPAHEKSEADWDRVLNTFAGGGVYCASKWGVVGLSGCMAEDLREHGIRVSVICPGSVATEFSSRAAKDPSKVLRPEDVAHAVKTIVTQGPQSFLSEIHLRPLRKS